MRALRQNLRVVATVVLLLLAGYVTADPLPPPQGRVLLSLSGNLGIPGNRSTSSLPADGSASRGQAGSAAAPVVDFDRPMLESLGLVTVATETPWTDGIIEFRGVLMRDLMARVAASGSHVHAAALDDYVVKLPLTDFTDHDVILATRIGDEPLSIRQNGPLWVIYPWSEHEELRKPHYYARSIWQVTTMSVVP